MIKSATVNYILNMAIPSSFKGVGNKETIVKRDHWEKQQHLAVPAMPSCSLNTGLELSPAYDGTMFASY